MTLPARLSIPSVYPLEEMSKVRTLPNERSEHHDNANLDRANFAAASDRNAYPDCGNRFCRFTIALRGACLGRRPDVRREDDRQPGDGRAPRQSSPLAQRQDKLRQIVAATFDFDEMSKSALGYHWKQITPDQQKEFSNAFVVFIEDSYLSKINDYRGQQVALRTSRSLDPQYTQVNTDIIDQSGQDPIHVNYLLQHEGGQWKIYDVTVDAISIMANYRNQFNRVMNNQGYDTLIGDLKSKQTALQASLANH